MKQIVIIGASGFATEVAWLIEEINSYKPEWEILGFVDMFFVVCKLFCIFIMSVLFALRFCLA